MASVSEVSGDWEGMLMITSEYDSEVGSWGNSDCLLCKGWVSTFSQFSRVDRPWCAFSAVLICVTSF